MCVDEMHALNETPNPLQHICGAERSWMDWPNLHEVPSFMSLVHDRYKRIMQNNSKWSLCKTRRSIFVRSKSAHPTKTGNVVPNSMVVHAHMATHLNYLVEAYEILVRKLRSMHFGKQVTLQICDRVTAQLFLNMLQETMQQKVRISNLKKTLNITYNSNHFAKSGLLECMHASYCIRQVNPQFPMPCLMEICTYLVKMC